MYALCILAGVAVAVALTERRSLARGAGPGVVTDVALPTVVAGTLGARIHHVATDSELYVTAGRHPLPTPGRRGVVTALGDLAGAARESDHLW